jgi:EAL domain-containing protein (putative c-di-GMP-specific phosphodiesterase class I)
MVLEIARIQQSKVVVEGIESQKQYDRLKEIGCDYFQGYHLERPHNYLKHK